MGIQLGSQFTVNTTLPLDDRQTVADLTARDAIDAGRRYEGMIVYVESEETNFQLVGGITDADWAELSGGGGGGAVVVGTTQTLSDTDVITLAQVQRERVKVQGSGGAVTVTIPNGTIDGQETYIQGASDSNPVTLLNSGNVRSNGDLVFLSGTLHGLMWDQTDTKWYQIGGI